MEMTTRHWTCSIEEEMTGDLDEEALKVSKDHY